MMSKIPERDWKKLRVMKDDALNIACEQIFEKIQKIMKEREGKEHETYLKLWDLLKKDDGKISVMFDGLKRSNAIHKLAAWVRCGVISNDCLSEFSDETRQTVKALNKGGR